jgi:hypothetical protein
MKVNNIALFEVWTPDMQSGTGKKAQYFPVLEATSNGKFYARIGCRFLLLGWCDGATF